MSVLYFEINNSKIEIRLIHFPKIAVEYVKLCGFKNGEIGRNHLQQCQNGTPEKLTLDEIAAQLGTSKRNLQRALRIERSLALPKVSVLPKLFNSLFKT